MKVLFWMSSTMVYMFAFTPRGASCELMCFVPVAFFAQGRDFMILPRLRLPPTQSVADAFGRMDEAQAREVDNHTKASESLHDAPDPVTNATTTWGMYNTTCHRQ